VFLVQSGGILTSLDAATGEVKKQGRLASALGDYYSSPVAAGEYLYTVSQTGKLSVLRAQADWEIVATVDLGEECYATPAPVDGRLYLRTASTLYAFGVE
jgi:hypothetical protein